MNGLHGKFQVHHTWRRILNVAQAGTLSMARDLFDTGRVLPEFFEGKVSCECVKDHC